MYWPLLTGVAVLFLALQHLVQTQPLPSDILKTECHKPVFWIWLSKDFVGSDVWQLETFNETGLLIVMKEPQASQCGYTITQDIYGNVVVRISFMGCLVINTNDLQFNISVQFRVFRSDGLITKHPLAMSCLTLKGAWDTREIICEENYMEVSVTRIIPIVIIKSLSLMEPVGVISQDWKVAFANGSTGTISARDAINRGYGVNVTLTRVVFRAPYHTAESLIEKVGNYSLEVIYSNMAFRQTLLALFVDTTLACPNDPPVITNTAVSWYSPAILRPLVTGDYFKNSIVNMGVNGHLLTAAKVKAYGYTLQTDTSTVGVSVPIGAEGGYVESDIVNDTYVTTYRTHLMLERQWLGINQDDSTTHTQFMPIVTPFIIQVPVFIDHTIKEKRYFNVSLGNFYSDVVLKSFIIDQVPLSLDILPPRDMHVMYAANPNRTQVFYLTVPFKDVVVEKTYLGGTRTSYKLYVTYVMNLISKGKDFTYTGIVEAILEDVVLPKFKGFCGKDSLLIEMERGNIDTYWIPYIRNLPLTRDLAVSQKYNVDSSDQFFLIEVPYPCIGLIYEEITLRYARVRLDLILRDNKTLENRASFSQTCIFPTHVDPVCLPDGSIIIMVNSSLTKPPIDARRTHLKDPKCTPVESQEDGALFNFSAYTCGTTRKFDGDYIYYENEVMYDRQVLLPNQPIISRDSNYRVTVRCRYPVRDTLSLSGRAKPSISTGLSQAKQARVLRRRARGHLAEMKIATDETCTLFYQPEDFPISVKSDEGLYIQIDVPTGMSVSLQDCWATNSSSNDEKSSWDLVVDGCVSKGELMSAQIQTSNNSAQLKVTFNGEFDRQILVNCQVLVCDARLTDHCPQTCNKTVEQVMGKKEVLSSELVSAGPVHITPQANNVRYEHLVEESWSMWVWCLSIGLAIVAAFTVGTIFLAVRLFVH